MPQLEIYLEEWPIRGSFTISRGSRTKAEIIVVELSEGTHLGRGECVPYARYGESLESVRRQIEELAGAITSGLSREELQDALPAGAARNALDCAMWDLDAKRAGASVWELAGLPAPGPLTSAYTLSLDSPSVMRDAACDNAARPLLKLKLAGPDDLARVEAVRSGAPDAAIIVDANEGWTADIYAALAPKLAALGVEMIEQPLPADADAALAEMERPVPVCADESCHDRASLPELEGRYDMINIKLDKSGGLTEALALKTQAEAMDFKVMVGCMLSTSLAMAPALLVAQGVQVVDLDGPLLLAQDRDHGLRFEGSLVHPAETALWG
jgi:L-alanine-DL-glutamate epimerase-like enolase superfamily enzyme